MGLHGDDYAEINSMHGLGLWEFLNPQITQSMISLPNYYTLEWAFPVLGYEYQWLYDVIKIIVHGINVTIAGLMQYKQPTSSPKTKIDLLNSLLSLLKNNLTKKAA